MRFALLAAAALVACSGGSSEEPRPIAVDAGAPDAAKPFGVRWARAAGDGSTQYGYGVAFAKNGDVVICSEYGGAVDFGSGVLDNPGGTTVSGFVARFTADGRPRFAASIRTSREASAYTIAVDARDHTWVGGYFKGELDVQGEKLASAGESDAFLVELDAAGKRVSARRFGDAGSQAITAIAIDRGGDVIFAGDFDSSIDLGGGALKSKGFADIFVARIGNDSTHRFSRAFGGTNLDQRPRLAIGDDGVIFLAATYRGPIDLGGGPLVDVFDGGFLAALAPDGSHRFSKGFAGDGWFFATSLAAANGRVAIGGRFTKSLDLGGGPLKSASGEDGVVGVFDATGKLERAHRFGGFGQDAISSVAIDPSGDVWITGETNETFGPLVSAGSADVVVARVTPDGSFAWSSRYGDVIEQRGTRVAVAPDGTVAVVGSFFGSLDFTPALRLSSNGGFDRAGGDVFVALFGR